MNTETNKPTAEETPAPAAEEPTAPAVEVKPKKKKTVVSKPAKVATHYVNAQGYVVRK